MVNWDIGSRNIYFLTHFAMRWSMTTRALPPKGPPWLFNFPMISQVETIVRWRVGWFIFIVNESGLKSCITMLRHKKKFMSISLRNKIINKRLCQCVGWWRRSQKMDNTHIKIIGFVHVVINRVTSGRKLIITHFKMVTIIWDKGGTFFLINTRSHVKFACDQ